MAGCEVRRAGGEMRELAVDEPQPVGAARLRTGGVEERQLEIVEPARSLDAARVGHVEQPHAGRLLADLEGLVGHSQDVSGQPERIAARHRRTRRRKLNHEHRRLGIADVDDAQAGLLPLMREVEDPPAILQLLQRHPLPAIAIAIQVELGDLLHVHRLGHALGVRGRHRDDGGDRKPKNASAAS
jgi:hypothetical protein